MTTFEEVRERLRNTPYPTSLTFAQVDAVMMELGYTRRQGAGSHVKYQKAGVRTRVFSIKRGKVGKAAVRDLALLIQIEGDGSSKS